MSVGIVVVSHSRALADAAVALACEMVDAGAAPPIAVAAGLDETTIGTDAMAVSEALGEVDSTDGVLVLCDLGSAVLSAEMALEFVDADLAARTTITPAPLVEGLVAAVVTASAGGSLAEVDREARNALLAKQQHLGDAADSPASDEPSADEDGSSVWSAELTNEHGLHARPAARFVAVFRGFEVTGQALNATTGAGPVDAASLTAVSTLGLEQGHRLEVRLSGPDTAAVAGRLDELVAQNFGDHAGAPPAGGAETAEAAGAPDLAGLARIEVDLSVDTSGYRAGSDEPVRWQQAVEQVDAHLARVAQACDHDTVTAILEATSTLLHDPSLGRAVDKGLASGASALDASTAAFGSIAAQFESAPSSYLRERAQDVGSLRRLTAAALVGADLAWDGPSEPCVLVLDELDAVTAAQLDPMIVRAVDISSSGREGHGVIVAQARGLTILPSA